jgi:hypothetical protein
MDNIIEPNPLFDFSKISLVTPVSIQGGAYFTKILYNDAPLYIQTPKSLTRQGFVKNGKKYFCDLMFDNESEDFITWIENLENKCQKIVCEKSNTWFESTLEMNDIESAFNPPLKLYKSGKYYLLRTHVKTNSLTNSPLIKIFNENETVLTMDDVNTETNIVSIIEIQGIKFTTRNFQIEFELKQVMVMKTDFFFESCLIKKREQQRNIVENIVEEHKEIEEEKEEEPKNIESLETMKKEGLDEILMETIHEERENQKGENSFESKEEEQEENEKGENEKGENEKGEMEEETKKNNNEIDLDLDLEIEDLNKEEEKNNFDEFDFSLSNVNHLETMSLKKPNEVYYEIYKQARKKAKDIKKQAVLAYLEARNIKKTYMLDDIENSDSEDESDFGEDFLSENDL